MTDMTVAQVAVACGVTERTVRRWLREGRLPASRVGGRVRIEAHAVQELATPYGEATGRSDSDARAIEDPWRALLDDPERQAAVAARRAARAAALIDQVRAMVTTGDAVPAGTDAVGLVRAGRDEQDAAWDERLR